jgi:hypothetical protein
MISESAHKGYRIGYLNITRFAYEVTEETKNCEKGMEIRAFFFTSPEENEEITNTSTTGMLHAFHECESEMLLP